MNPIIKFAKKIAKNNAFLRKIMRQLAYVYRTTKYNRRVSKISVSDKTVVFNAFNGTSVCCTPKAVFNYMRSCDEYKDFEYIWVVKKPEDYKYLTEIPNTKVVKDKSVEFEEALGRAKYWFFNYTVYNYIHPKKDQVYVQCWHGTPLKRLGYDIEKSDNAMNSLDEIKKRYKVEAAKFDYLLSPSAFTTEKFASAWNLNKTGQTDKLVEVGYPRNDFLINYSEDDVRRIKSTLGLPGDKKIILYAPTWRDNQHSIELGYTYKTELDFDRLKELVAEDTIVLFRAHYLVANSFDFEKYSGFIYDVSNYDDINELYIISDMLITDYSSVFFDYANLNRPIIFYMYDLKSYANDMRGFYFDLSELPGPIVEDENALFDKIIEYKDKYANDKMFAYDEKYVRFNEKFNGLNDGCASKRLVDYVIGVK